MTYMGIRRRCSTIWYVAVGWWMVLLNRFCRMLNVDSGPLEIWIIAKTAWIVNDRPWLWLWEIGVISGDE